MDRKFGLWLEGVMYMCRKAWQLKTHQNLLCSSTPYEQFTIQRERERRGMASQGDMRE